MKKLLIVLVILTITFIPNIVVHASDLESSIEINKYTITFNTNGGNEIENQIILENELVNKPISIKEGYQFNEVISVLVNGQNIDNLLELQNNSSYGTSYISVGKIIIPK